MKAADLPDIDLSGLNEFRVSDVGTVQAAAKGQPIELPLDEIEEDTENARTEYDEAYLQELAASIRADRVREPISVRSKGTNGKYRLNSGSCRVRASRIAGKSTIAAVIDDTADAVSNAVVNIQRNNLSPMDIARFVAKELPKYEGNKSRLAERLGKSSAYITQHLALLQLPPVVRELYDKQVSRNATALYELARLHKKDAALVERALAGETEIGSALLAELNTAVKGTQAPPTGQTGGREGKKHRPVKKSGRPDHDTLSVRVLVKHKGKVYELAGEFSTQLKPSAPGRIFVRKGGSKPLQVAVEDLTLDSIVVK